MEIKIADRGKALDQLARILGFYNDKLELTASQELLDAARRINASSPPLDPGYMAKNAARLVEHGD
ncbi:hypothetical protein [Roseovarius marisflavi]|uniref:hypothetical protein n=1 Tax=Roseovarius marisflavi TaxID=1054996 RepID=UPI000933DF0C|nr:hypothetical protein [Roseovarius marisflavi]